MKPYRYIVRTVQGIERYQKEHSDKELQVIWLQTIMDRFCDRLLSPEACDILDTYGDLIIKGHSIWLGRWMVVETGLLLQRWPNLHWSYPDHIIEHGRAKRPMQPEHVCDLKQE